MSYEAPIRCQQCGTIIQKKPRAKMPKNCAPCREKDQDSYRAQLKADRKRKVRGR
jgi:hypothetical protein